jgi:hypothetical protein
MKLSTRLHLVPGLSMRGAIPSLPTLPLQLPSINQLCSSYDDKQTKMHETYIYLRLQIIRGAVKGDTLKILCRYLPNITASFHNYKVKRKGKVRCALTEHHAMKTYWKNRGISLGIL